MKGKKKVNRKSLSNANNYKKNGENVCPAAFEFNFIAREPEMEKFAVRDMTIYPTCVNFRKVYVYSY
jgi:hypothetical protein